MSKPIKLNKVPIASLIQVLTHLYEEGADFIDITGESTSDSDNDIIKVIVRPEYYLEEDSETTPEYLFTEEEYNEPTEENINPISDNNINDFI